MVEREIKQGPISVSQELSNVRRQQADVLVFSVCHKYRPEAKKQWLAPVLLGMGCRL